MAVFIGGIGATKTKPPVFVYDLYKETNEGLKFVKQVKIRRKYSWSAREAMIDFIIKLKKTKPGYYQFELNKVIGEEGRI